MTEYASPEPPKTPDIKRVDFAPDFHDLLHHWWQDCDNLPLHFKHWADYVWRPRWRSWTVCQVGRHSRLGASWQRKDGEMQFIGWSCSWCGRRWMDPGSRPHG